MTALSDWGKPARPVPVNIDPAVDMKTPPKQQVDTLPADKFFAYAAALHDRFRLNHVVTPARAGQSTSGWPWIPLPRE